MIQRTTNPNSKGRGHHRYRENGITVCARWRDFRNFLADMGERPDGMTLDRCHNLKGYSPDNCRWATVAEQNQNKSNTKLTPTAVERIRDLRRVANVTHRALGKYFNVSHVVIGKILRGELWSNV